MENNEIIKAEVVSENSLTLMLKAEIDTQIATAHAFPRSIKTFLDKAMSIATVSDSVAASCNYSLPRGGKVIEGPTVRLAEIVCSTYGNIRSGARVISNNGKIITAQGICHDLETNNCVTVEVNRKITDRSGKTFSEDMIVIAGNAACAIAFRNAVFKVIPSALIQEVYEQTKLVAKGTVATLIERRDKALNYAKSQGITDKQICTVLEIKKIEDIDLDKLSILRGMLALITNGESTAKDLFDTSIEEINPDELQMLYESKKSFLTEEEIKDIDRILKKKEVSSYKKVKDYLDKKEAK